MRCGSSRAPPSAAAVPALRAGDAVAAAAANETNGGGVSDAVRAREAARVVTGVCMKVESARKEGPMSRRERQERRDNADRSRCVTALAPKSRSTCKAMPNDQAAEEQALLQSNKQEPPSSTVNSNNDLCRGWFPHLQAAIGHNCSKICVPECCMAI